MDWNKPWNEVQSAGVKKKWNYVLVESLKMAVLLPMVILLIEIFILGSWPDVRESPQELAYDFLFLFSVIFLIFVVFHIVRWKWHSRSGRS